MYRHQKINYPLFHAATKSIFFVDCIQIRSESKLMVFMAAQNMVDYYNELLSLEFSPLKSDDSGKINLFKLHGSMSQKASCRLAFAYLHEMHAVLRYFYYT